jgi:GntR family transcriptional regulator / MocR family aminotransferase
MPKRSRSAALPLPAGGAPGLTLREEIYRTCVAAMQDGRLPPGSRLPSARVLAADWHVSRNTVDDAILQLQADGFVVRRVGDGTYVAAAAATGGRALRHGRLRPPAALGRAALASASDWGRATTDAWTPHSAPRPRPFMAGLPALDQFPLDLWRRLVARRLRASGVRLLGYFPALGYGPLREATARHLATTRGIACAPAQVMIVNSTMQALDLIGRALLNPGDRVWVEDPSFPNLRATLALSGVRQVAVPVDGHGLDVGRGIALAPRAALACVTPSFQYPTGAVLALERRLELIRWARAARAWLVEDDYQSEFTHAGRALPALHSLDGGDRVIYVGTYTNSLFPSLRLAYAVLPRPLVALFEAVRRQQDDHTHGPLQAVLADFIDGGHFSAHLRRMRSLYRARREALVAACARELPAEAVLGPTGAGMSAALHLAARAPDSRVAAAALAAGIPALALSRHSIVQGRCNGLLLGYAALSERRIAAAAARLAPVLATALR